MFRKTLKTSDALTADKKSVGGYASVFGNVDSYGDRIVAGAYAKTIKQAAETGLPMLFNHDPDKVIGRWLVFEEDEKGLSVSGDLTPEHSLSSDVAALLKAGHVDGLSIGFSIDKFREVDGVRELQEITLHEISVVTFPADTYARGGMKAADMTRREFERSLIGAMRDAGYEMSRSDAIALLNDGYDGLNAKRDAGGRLEKGAVNAALITAIREAKENPNGG